MIHAEHADSRTLNDQSGRVIGCAFTVLNTLGAGFLEKVYGNALALELRAAGLSVEQQCGVKVHYNDVVVGEYFADMLQVVAACREIQAAMQLQAAWSPSSQTRTAVQSPL